MATATTLPLRRAGEGRKGAGHLPSAEGAVEDGDPGRRVLVVGQVEAVGVGGVAAVVEAAAGNRTAARAVNLAPRCR